MKRSLQRNFARTLRGIPKKQWIHTFVQFPENAFTDAPTWSPGEGFVPAIDNHTWYKYLNEHVVHCVVASVWPKQLPAYDGGEWLHTEIWTVELDLRTDIGMLTFPELWDKPHRVTWLLGNEDHDNRILSRQPLAGHPIEQIQQYWEDFEGIHGFTPHFAYHHGIKRYPWILIDNTFDFEDSIPDTIAAILLLRKKWAIKVKVYRDPHWKDSSRPQLTTCYPDDILVAMLALQREGKL